MKKKSTLDKIHMFWGCDFCHICGVYISCLDFLIIVVVITSLVIWIGSATGLKMHPDEKEKWEVRPYSFILPWWIFFKSYRPINVSFIDFIKSFKLIFAKRNQTVSDIIKKNSLIYRRFWKPFTIAVLNTHPNEASAKLLFNVIIKTLFFRNDPLKPYITKKSLDDSLIKPAIKKILSKKIKIKTKSRLKKIIFKNNFAEKIIINNDIIKINKKDLVILAVTPNIISRIIPKFKVPKKTNCILNIHFKLNQIHKKIKLPNNSFFVGIIGGTIDWIFKKKKYSFNYYKCCK